MFGMIRGACIWSCKTLFYIIDCIVYIVGFVIKSDIGGGIGRLLDIVLGTYVT